MSNHNYSKYSSKNRNEFVEDEVIIENNVADTEEVVEVTEPEIAVVEGTVETVTLPETVTGTVANCIKLNVRVEPNATADVVCVLDAKAEVKIDATKSTNEWLSVLTATGIEGYCMRKFVEASL